MLKDLDFIALAEDKQDLCLRFWEAESKLISGVITDKRLRDRTIKVRVSKKFKKRLDELQVEDREFKLFF